MKKIIIVIAVLLGALGAYVGVQKHLETQNVVTSLNIKQDDNVVIQAASTCSSNSDCAGGNCAGNTDETLGLCQPCEPNDEGMMCNNNGDCCTSDTAGYPAFCSTGGFCSTGATGSSCDSDGDCVSGICSGSGGAMFCQPCTVVGSSCTIASDGSDACCSGSSCNDGTCQVVCSGAQAACTTDSDCCSLQCNLGSANGSCASVSSSVDSCTTSSDCTKGFYCSNDTCKHCKAGGASCSSSEECCNSANCDSGVCVLGAIIGGAVAGGIVLGSDGYGISKIVGKGGGKGAEAVEDGDVVENPMITEEGLTEAEAAASDNPMITGDSLKEARSDAADGDAVEDGDTASDIGEYRESGDSDDEFRDTDINDMPDDFDASPEDGDVADDVSEAGDDLGADGFEFPSDVVDTNFSPMHAKDDFDAFDDIESLDGDVGELAEGAEDIAVEAGADGEIMGWFEMALSYAEIVGVWFADMAVYLGFGAEAVEVIGDVGTGMALALEVAAEG